MTTANVTVKHILLKRGTTTKNLAYTGPAGEVTIDTDLDTLRIHDGVTPGGNVVGGGGGVSSAVTNAINANVAAANVQITSLWANAAAQATSITSLSANIVAANSAIVTANVRMKSYVDTQISGISLTPGLWFNTTDARLYVKYNSQWVDASPAVIPPTSTYTGELVIDGTRISNTDYAGSKDVEIENADSVWKFTGAGVLELPTSIKFPDNTIQTTAWNSSSLLEIDGGDASTWLTV